MNELRVTNGSAGWEREPLFSSFGFKGSYATCLWQVAVVLAGNSGHTGTGVGVQSVLWSDAQVYASHCEEESNLIMFRCTQYAVELLKGKSFSSPPDAMNRIIPEVYEYAKKITGRRQLRKTFVLNSLVPVDFALWQLYARENGISSFEKITEPFAGAAYTHKHTELAAIPLITYGLTEDKIGLLAEDGTSLMKIKIGSDPNKNGSFEEMLLWDKKRLAYIHGLLKDYTARHTVCGRIGYYLDANGRYPSKEMLLEFLDYADKIGAMERILLFEEPFPEDSGIDVFGIPVRVAGDESAHCREDVERLLELGYSAIALKPIAKTLSASLEIAGLAQKHHIPCFCADLTVNPLMVEWNKCVAARLAPIPGMKTGVLESNGPQNYINWVKMQSWLSKGNHPYSSNPQGTFLLDEGFYKEDGGIFEPSPHYEALASGLFT